MNHIDFVKRQKMQRLRKSLEKDKLPEQGSFVSLYNNDYKMLTKSDALICLLEDIKGNKVAFPRKELLKLLKKALDQSTELSKADSATPKAVGNRPAFAVGEIHNGRKKIVSSKTGKTMWVDVGQGHAYGEHDSEEKLSHEGSKEQVNHFFESVGDKIHPGDKMKIARQLREVVALKEQLSNLKEVAAHESANKESKAAFKRDRMFALQDKYSSKFKELREALVESAKKRKAEGI